MDAAWAAGRLHPRARAGRRDPYHARRSPAGGEGESACLRQRADGTGRRHRGHRAGVCQSQATVGPSSPETAVKPVPSLESQEIRAEIIEWRSRQNPRLQQGWLRKLQHVLTIAIHVPLNLPFGEDLDCVPVFHGSLCEVHDVTQLVLDVLQIGAIALRRSFLAVRGKYS